MPGSDALYFKAKLKANAGGVSSADSQGLWVWSESGTRLILRKGQSVDLGSGVLKIKSFEVLSTVEGSAGHGRYDAAGQRIDALLSFADGTMAVATIGQDAGIELIAVSGQEDAEGRVVAKFGTPSSPGNGDAPAGLITFRQGEGGVTKANAVAAWDFAQGSSLARGAEAVPGVSGATFKSLQNPVAGLGLNGERITAFGATVRGVAAAEDTGLWVYRNGALELLAREGSETTGVAGARWKKFDSLTVIEGRGPAFTAKIATGSTPVEQGNDRGLWVTDSDGELRLLLLEGDVVAGKTLRSFSLLQPLAGSPGQRRSWTINDPTATLIYLATFTDGTTAIVTVSIP
jgi:hypothetical protein